MSEDMEHKEPEHVAEKLTVAEKWAAYHSPTTFGLLDLHDGLWMMRGLMVDLDTRLKALEKPKDGE